MKFLNYPLKNFRLTQGFGGNANTAYHTAGLVGHPAIDYVTYYGDSIRLACDSYVYSLLNKDNPDLGKYRAVCTLVETPEGVYEVIYGHDKDIIVNIGNYKMGTIIATEGNTGEVYGTNGLVTESEKLAGSKAGTHLHFQVRPVQKTKNLATGKRYLIDKDGNTFQKDGYYYFVPNFENGFNGCVDPVQFLTGVTADVLPPAPLSDSLFQKLMNILRGIK